MHEKYIKDTDTFARRAGHVAEEMGEVLAAYGKVQRFGWHSVNPELCPEDEKYMETNLQWYLRECTDLAGALSRMIKYANEELAAGRL